MYGLVECEYNLDAGCRYYLMTPDCYIHIYRKSLFILDEVLDERTHYIGLNSNPFPQ